MKRAVKESGVQADVWAQVAAVQERLAKSLNGGEVERLGVQLSIDSRSAEGPADRGSVQEGACRTGGVGIPMRSATWPQ